MDPRYFLFYFLGINLLTFLILTVSFLLSRRRGDPSLPGVLFLVLLAAGGSVGGLLACLIWARKPKGRQEYEASKPLRDSILSWKVPCILFLIIHLLLCFLIFALPALPQSWFVTAGSFLLRQWKWVGLYFLLMNLTAFACFGIDKRQAIREGRRISISALFTLAALGGALGSVVGMDFFHHKTKKLYFRLGLPLILVIHLMLVLVFLLPYLQTLR